MAISKTTLAIAPVAVAALLYRLVEFDPAPLPEEALSRSPNVPANRYGVLGSAERIGEGLLPSNEDLAYDADTGLLYTGCSDGWIKRFHVEDSAEKVKVENWAYTGGRPLGLAFGPDKQLTVADADKGLLRVISNGEGGATPKVELLTDEAEGLKFRLTDSQDVGRDGVIYFTDASYKYSYADHLYDVLEGRPYGRLLSFDPSTNETKVLVRDLYFANGVTLSPDQEFLIFCETMLQRCNKYHLQGKKKGIVENFIDNLPGMPDNIRYDGDGHYWIALAAGKTAIWETLLRYPIARKAVWILEKLKLPLPDMSNNAGVIAVDLKGEAIAYFTEPGLFTITGGLQIRNQLYMASLANSYIIRFNLTFHLS